MRKLIVSMNVTLDGFLSGPNCELDWHFNSWTAEMAETLGEQLKHADTILLGRITYSAMAKYWPAKALDTTAPPEDLAFIYLMNQYHKIVFSQTLSVAEWQNSTLVKESLTNVIKKLKKQGGKNLMLYGSAKLVTSLIKLNLIDEFHLWVHPVILGQGKPLFRTLLQQRALKLLKIKKFASGVVLFFYKVEKTGLASEIKKRKRNYEKKITN